MTAHAPSLSGVRRKQAWMGCETAQNRMKLEANKQQKELMRRLGKGTVEQKGSGSLEKVMWSTRGILERL